MPSKELIARADSAIASLMERPESEGPESPETQQQAESVSQELADRADHVIARMFLQSPEQRASEIALSRFGETQYRPEGTPRTDFESAYSGKGGYRESTEVEGPTFDDVYGPEIAWIDDYARSGGKDVKKAYKEEFPAWGDDWGENHQERYDRAKRVWDSAKAVVNTKSGTKQYGVAREQASKVPEEDHEKFLYAVYVTAKENADMSPEKGGFLGWLDTTGKGLYRGLTSIIPNAEATLSKIMEVEGGTYGESSVRGVEAVNVARSGDPTVPSDASWYTRYPAQAAEMAPQMAAGIGLGAATGPAAPATATAFWATQIFPDEYAKLRRSGLKEDSAKKAAIASAVIQGAIEQLEFNPFGKAKGLKTIRDAAKQAAKSYGKEVSEEGLQSIVSDTVKNLTVGMDEKEAGVLGNAVDAMLQSAGPLAVMMAPGAAVSLRNAAKTQAEMKASAEQEEAEVEVPELPQEEQEAQPSSQSKPKIRPKDVREALNPERVKKWVQDNPEARTAFEAFAAKDKPSRKDVKTIFASDIRLSADQRADLSEMIRKALLQTYGYSLIDESDSKGERQLTFDEFSEQRPPIKGYVYHGSPEGDLPAINTWCGKACREGLGFYVTENADVAKGYAAGRTARGQLKKDAKQKGKVNYIKIDEDANILDMDSSVDADLWKKVTDRLDEDYPDPSVPGNPFGRNTNGSAMQDLVHGMVHDSMYPLDEAFYVIREVLEDMGYDGTTHIEGRKQGKPHRVHVLFGTVLYKEGLEAEDTAKFRVVNPEEAYEDYKKEVASRQPLPTPDEPKKPEAAIADRVEKSADYQLWKLAIPSENIDVRNFIEETRKNDWTRKVISDNEAREEAKKQVSENYEETKSIVTEKLLNNMPMNNTEIAAAQGVMEQEYLAAAESGDSERLKDAGRLVLAYTDLGTRVSSELRIFGPDPVETPKQRNLRGMMESFYEEPPKVKAAVAKIERMEAKKTRSRSKQAREDLSKAIDDFANYVSGMTFANPLMDPKLIQLSANLATKALKAGYVEFAEFSRAVARKVGDGTAEKLRPLLQKTWQEAKAEYQTRPKVQEAAAEKIKSLREEWINEVVSRRDLLKKLGIDIAKVREYADDDIKSEQVMGQLHAIKSSIPDKAFEYWSNAILSAAETTNLNIGMNIVNATYRATLQRFTEAVVNSVLRRPEGAQWGEFKYLLKGILPGLTDGFANAVKTFRTDIPWLDKDISGEKYNRRIDSSGVAIKGKFGHVVRSLGFKRLGFGDQLIKTAVWKTEVGAQAYRTGKSLGLEGDKLSAFIQSEVEDKTSGSSKRAIEIAVERAFQEESKATEIGLSIRKSLPGSRYFIPFITTPANVIMQGLRQTPFGTPLLIYRLLRHRYAGDKAPKLTEHIAEQLISYAVLAALLKWMDDEDGNPRITGAAGGMSYRTRQGALRTAPPNSIRVGVNDDGEDVWVSYGRGDPFASAISVSTDTLRAIKSGDTKKIIGTPLKSVIGQLHDKSFLQGMSDLVKLMDVSASKPVEDRILEWVSSFSSSWVPNMVRATLRAVKDEYPERGVWGKSDEYYERLAKRTWQKTEFDFSEEPKVDVWGRKPSRYTGFGPFTDFLYRVMVPARVSRIDVAKGDQALVNWNAHHPEDEQFIVSPQKTYKLNGETKYMTDEQWTQYATLAGKAAKIVVDSEIANIENPTETDMKTISSGVRDARSLAKAALIKEWTGGDKAPTYEELARKIKDKHILTHSRDLASTMPRRGEERKAWIEEAKKEAQWLKDRGIGRDEILRVWRAKRNASRRKDTRFDPKRHGERRLIRNLNKYAS